MEFVAAILHAAPEVAIFACLFLGVPLGRLKLGRFSLGNAAAVLLVAVILGICVTGPAGIMLPTTLKTVAFGLFVFSVGFSGGPQFFASLSWRTLDTVVIAVTVSVVGLITAVVLSRLLGFDKGMAAGMAAGALTETALLGTASGALHILPLSPEAIRELEANAAVSFALTYVFGTVMVVFFCSQLAPRLMGVDLKAEAAALEAKLKESSGGPAHGLAYRRLDARGFRVTTAAGRSIGEIEAKLAIGAASIQFVSRDGEAAPVTRDLRLEAGDELVVAGRRPAIVAASDVIGPELEGWDLMAPLETYSADVVVTSRKFSGLTVAEVAAQLGEAAHGVYLLSVTRFGNEIAIDTGMQVMVGDQARIIGPRASVDRVIQAVGRQKLHADRSDLAMLGFGLMAGTLFGLLEVEVGGIPITLGSGGAILISGLVCGWYHARHPLIGDLPPQASRVLWDVGLAVFVAIIGLNAGPAALAALQAQGASVLLAGIVTSTVPLLVALFVGRVLLRMNPVILIGAIAGSQTQDAAMLAASDAAESSTPVLGFTVAYAVGNISLTMIGPLVVALS
jgi:putative transport protein